MRAGPSGSSGLAPLLFFSCSLLKTYIDYLQQKTAIAHDWALNELGVTTVVTVEDTIQVSFLRKMNDRSHFGPFWPDLSAARTTTSAWMQTPGGARVSRQNSPQRKGPHQRCGKTHRVQGD